MRRLLAAAAALAAGLVIAIGFTLPPRRVPLARSPDGTIAGILHVHTTRSDGSGTPDQVAAAAARAGLQFVALADHGDGTRPLDPPAYRSGVLCLDGLEVSTTGGHYLALDMRPSPYPLGGEPRDVVDDVRRLGGFGVVAHPDSPTAALRWREWTAPFDAMEWLNLDTSWRQHWVGTGWGPRLALAQALLDYPVRPVEAIGRLIDGGGDLPRFDALAHERRVVLLAGADAHARLAFRNADPGDHRPALPLPGYEATFRAISIHLALEGPLTHDAAHDAAMVIRALRAGHGYTAVDAFATPPSFEFTASNDLGTVHEGDELGVSGPVTLKVRSNAPPLSSTFVYRDGVLMHFSGDREVSVAAPAEPAVYRVEIREPSASFPGPRWIVSNPIYVRGPANGNPPDRPPPTAVQPIASTACRIEHDPASDGRCTSQGGAVRFDYRLGHVSPYVALVFDTPDGVGQASRLTFAARADEPMRVSVQLRDGANRRWRRSIYIGRFDQDRIVEFEDFMPVDPVRAGSAPPDQVRSILFAIDTVNTRRGSSGQVWLTNIALAK